MILKTLSLTRNARILTAALVAVIGLGAAKTARAEHTPYAQTITCYSASTNQCYALFPAVPAKKTLVVEYISSVAATQTPLSDAEFDVNNGSAFVYILHTLQYTNPNGDSTYVASQPMLYYWSAGQQPYFVMNAQAGPFEFISGAVTLTGYLEDTP
jgi:hypothetical protein